MQGRTPLKMKMIKVNPILSFKHNQLVYKLLIRKKPKFLPKAPNHKTGQISHRINKKNGAC